MEPRLLQLINNVILFAIDGKPIKYVAVLLNDDSENVPVGFTGHISFEAKGLDGNALVEYVSGDLSGDTYADSLKVLNALSNLKVIPPLS